MTSFMSGSMVKPGRMGQTTSEIESSFSPLNNIPRRDVASTSHLRSESPDPLDDPLTPDSANRPLTPNPIDGSPSPAPSYTSLASAAVNEKESSNVRGSQSLPEKVGGTSGTTSTSTAPTTPESLGGSRSPAFWYEAGDVIIRAKPKTFFKLLRPRLMQYCAYFAALFEASDGTSPRPVRSTSPCIA